jgi:hypothetical protein
MNTIPDDPFERFVLLAMVDLEQTGETPAHSFDVRDRCAEHVDRVHGVGGGVGRNEVYRALETLTEAGLVSSEQTSSPVGKGRPAHALAADPGEVLAALEADADVGEYAATLSA